MRGSLFVFDENRGLVAFRYVPVARPHVGRALAFLLQTHIAAVCPEATRVLVFLGGLGDSLLCVPYFPSLVDAVGALGWAVVQASCGYTGGIYT